MFFYVICFSVSAAFFNERSGSDAPKSLKKGNRIKGCIYLDVDISLTDDIFVNSTQRKINAVKLLENIDYS